MLWYFLTLLVPVVMALTPVEQARNEFVNQYDLYRTVYTEFQLKNNQYKSNPTFAREEELVVAAKEMVLQRNQVWWAYFQALKVEVAENLGLKDDLKSGLQSNLQNEQNNLDQAKTTITSIENREDLMTQALNINNKAADYFGIGIYTEAYLRQAKIDYAASELTSFGKAIRQAAGSQILDPEVKSARIRGIEEGLAALDSTRQTMASESAKLNSQEK